MVHTSRQKGRMLVPKGSCHWHSTHLAYMYISTCQISWQVRCKKKLSIKLQYRFISLILELNKSVTAWIHIDHRDIMLHEKSDQNRNCLICCTGRISLWRFIHKQTSPSILCKVKICINIVWINRITMSSKICWSSRRISQEVMGDTSGGCAAGRTGLLLITLGH